MMLSACGDVPQIEAHMVDPSYVLKVSKFRSCCGHTYGSEPDRSMKHYLSSRPDMLARNDYAGIYAPFDGFVVIIEPENNLMPCYGNVPQGEQVRFASKKNPNHMVRLFHTNPQVGLGFAKKGTLLAYADLRSCDENDPSKPGTRASTFDISYEGINGSTVSIFDHMSPSVLAQWGEVGITPENIKISKETRDADPCTSYAESVCRLDNVCLTGQDCE